MAGQNESVLNEVTINGGMELPMTAGPASIFFAAASMHGEQRTTMTSENDSDEMLMDHRLRS